jgi:hypothetical protein
MENNNYDKTIHLSVYIDTISKPILFGRSLLGWVGFLVGLLILIATLLNWNINEKWQIALNFFMAGFLWGNFYSEGWVIKFRQLVDRALENCERAMKIIEENDELLEAHNKLLEAKTKIKRGNKK